MRNKGTNKELCGRRSCRGLLRRVVAPCGIAGLSRGVSVLAGIAVLLTGCVKDMFDTYGSGSGSDGDVVVGFRPGTLTIAGATSGGDGWNTRSVRSGASSSGRAGAATRAGLPPTGMVEGAFQIGDLWVDGNRGTATEKGMTWAEAMTYCQELGLRLPTEDEARNEIIPYVRANDPLPDSRKFVWRDGSYDEYYYWTSTPRSADANYVWSYYMHSAHTGVLGSMEGRDASYDAAPRCVKRDGELPPAPETGPEVENPDGLPAGTTFRVLVYNAGDDPRQDVPVDQNTYVVTDDQGTIVATAVDERGNATDGDTREIVLRRGAYDFYYFSPALPVSDNMRGTYTSLTNGVDYMALAHREVIDPSQGHKHYIPEVCFYRMGSYIDVRISPKSGEVVGLLEVTGEGLQLWGFPLNGYYEVGEYPYRIIANDEGGMVGFGKGDFASESGKTATVSTLGGGGHVVLPGYVESMTVRVTLTSDGKEMKLSSTLSGYVFEPGYRYVIELRVGRIGDKPELDVEVLPWNENDWDYGSIGGGSTFKVGDLYGGGIIYWVNPSDGSDIRIMTLNQSSSQVTWGRSYQYVLGAGAQSTSARNGSDIWPLAKAYSDNKTNGATGVFATDFPAFSYCYELTDGGVDKGTWYLPSWKELQEIQQACDVDGLKAVIAAAGGTAWSRGEILSATEAGNTTQMIHTKTGAGGWYQNNKTYNYFAVCARRRDGDKGGMSVSVSPAIGIIPVEGGSYSFMVTGSLPSGGVDVRLQSGDKTLASGKVTLSGRGVSLKVPANEDPESRTVRFQYLSDGQWISVGSAVQMSSGYIYTGGSGTVVEYSDPGQSMSRADGVEYCKGKGDGWRLPTHNELMYYWGVVPSIPDEDGVKFNAGSYLTATNNESHSGAWWTTEFLQGRTSDASSSGYVRCVKDLASDGVQAGRWYPYVTSDNGGVVVVLRDGNGGIDEASLFSSRVTATKTGNETSADNRMSRKFRVQKSDPGKKTWADAISYCDNLNEEGKTDWRLPSQRELMMIWLLGGNGNATSGDKNDTGVGSASIPFAKSYLYRQSDFTAFEANDYWTANENGASTAYSWYVRFSTGEVFGLSQLKTNRINVRCVRDEEGSAYVYEVTNASTDAPSVIPIRGGTYSVTLTGSLPVSVPVRVSVNGAAGVSRFVIKSGEAVQLTVPSNDTGTPRTVVFEYKLNGEWTAIEERTQEGYYYVTEAKHNAPSTIPGQGGTYSVTLTGLLPTEGVPVRASVGGTVLATGTAPKSGTAVELKVPAKTSYNNRTVSFEYEWDGAWVKIGDDRTQQGYNVTAATHNAPASIPSDGGTYTITLTGWGGFKTRAVSGSTVLATNDNNSDDASKTSITRTLTVPANTGAQRTVTFQYYFNAKWKDIAPAVTQEGYYYVTSATHNAPSTIPGQGGAYSVTLTGLLPAEGVPVRASVGGTALATGTVAQSGTAVELAVPANTGAQRTVTFQYYFDGSWTNIASAVTQKAIAVGDVYGGGVVSWVNPDDASDFRIVAMDEPQFSWAANASYVLGSGAQSETARNGADVWKIAKAYSDAKTNGATGTFATDFPAFSYCYEKTDGGVAKGTWYLPSKQELLDLYDTRGTVEPVITSNGGTAFLAGYCWSATEISDLGYNVWNVDVYYGNATWDPKSARLFVRCLRGK